MNASRKGPECKDRECRKRAGIAVHNVADVSNEHEAHRHEHRGPMQRLGPDKTQLLLPGPCVLPSRDHAEDTDERR